MIDKISNKKIIIATIIVFGFILFITFANNVSARLRPLLPCEPGDCRCQSWVAEGEKVGAGKGQGFGCGLAAGDMWDMGPTIQVPEKSWRKDGNKPASEGVKPYVEVWLAAQTWVTQKTMFHTQIYPNNLLKDSINGCPTIHLEEAKMCDGVYNFTNFIIPNNAEPYGEQGVADNLPCNAPSYTAWRCHTNDPPIISGSQPEKKYDQTYRCTIYAKPYAGWLDEGTVCPNSDPSTNGKYPVLFWYDNPDNLNDVGYFGTPESAESSDQCDTRVFPKRPYCDPGDRNLPYIINDNGNSKPDPGEKWQWGCKNSVFSAENKSRPEVYTVTASAKIVACSIPPVPEICSWSITPLKGKLPLVVKVTPPAGHTCTFKSGTGYTKTGVTSPFYYTYAVGTSTGSSSTIHPTLTCEGYIPTKQCSAIPVQIIKPQSGNRWEVSP